MTTRYLRRGDLRLAYDVDGEGPLVVALHGMGDDRSAWRFVAPMVIAAGFRFASLDLRGHGESDAGFDRFDDVALASDALALIEELGGPAVLLGNSMGAGAAVIAAADRPDLVSALGLFGAFVRDPANARLLRPLMRIMVARPWGPAVWRSYSRSLFPGPKPADLEERSSASAAAIRAHWAAFVKTTGTTHAPAEAVLDRVRVPTLVVMGGRDRDFPDPAAEGRAITDRLGGELLVLPDSGHYPMVDDPEGVRAALVGLLGRVSA